jgi:hypothetical protein
MRDYDTLRAHYNHLLDKKLSADMYTSLVTHEQGERFEILDPAIVPSKPYGPNRFVYALAALLGGLVAGIGLAIVMEMTDPSVRNEHEAADILGAGVVVSIPIIFTPPQTRTMRLRAIGVIAITISSAAVLGLIVSYILRRMA